MGLFLMWSFRGSRLCDGEPGYGVNTRQGQSHDNLMERSCGTGHDHVFVCFAYFEVSTRSNPSRANHETHETHETKKWELRR